MQIRAIESGDYDEWLRLRRALWPECATSTLEAEVADILADLGNQAVFVAVRPTGSLGGFVEASIHPHAIGCDTRPVGYVEGWYIDQDLRGLGIGRRLLTAAETWARSKGCTEIASDTLSDNESGLAAHRACGYTITGSLIHFKKRL
ncbi:MAG: GNAT family N-acetyltransferase [Phycisphaerales bacterium]|nr:MAG: GNAT family N-acetyltransferase [Phycisphaerales bacterium]